MAKVRLSTSQRSSVQTSSHPFTNRRGSKSILSRKLGTFWLGRALCIHCKLFAYLAWMCKCRSCHVYERWRHDHPGRGDVLRQEAPLRVAATSRARQAGSVLLAVQCHLGIGLRSHILLHVAVDAPARTGNAAKSTDEWMWVSTQLSLTFTLKTRKMQPVTLTTMRLSDRGPDAGDQNAFYVG